VWALFLIVAATGTAVAQQSIQLSTGSLPLTEVSRLAALRPDAQAGRQGNRYFFIARFSRFDAAQREAWQREGLLLGHRLDGQTWWVSAPQQPISSWLQAHSITAIAIAPAEAKTSRLLAGNQAPAWARNANGTISLVVETELTAGEQNARGWMQQAGFAVAKPITQSPALWQVEVRPGDISRLAALPFVTYVQPINPPDQPINDRSRYFAAAPLLNNAAPAGRDLRGEGITVGVGDDSYPINHPDVMDRVIDHTPAVSGFTANRLYRHGAHVSGTVLGGGILSPERAGFAPQATLVAQWFSGVWLNAADYTSLYNMVITNNSYGAVVGDCGYTGQYDLYAQQLDQQAFNFPQLLHVFAAGNSGGDVCSPFPPGYQTVLGGYQSAKNVITVANADGQNMFGSSSAGPVRDGRLKPEIAAQGTNVLSTDAQYPSNAYYNEIGTSMSSPAVAGGLALLYQRYRQLNANANPPGALMKTLLLNGASDRGTPGPDYRWGYGFMNLKRSLLMMEGNQYAERQVSQSSTQEITISVPAGTSTLKVMLYWHDPAASPLAAKTLVNDLDLEVITPGGQTLLPLVLNANPAAVTQPAQPGTDRINNGEQVVIANPQPGTYTLRMRGFDVPAGPQTAYLAYDFLPAGIDLQVPAAGTRL
jgi:hypothetical protein